MIKRVSKIKTVLEQIPTPCYVLEEELLEQNLKLLKHVSKKSGAKILLALKGYAFHKSFNMVKEYLKGCCASGLHEAMLASEEFGKEVHTYSPAFKDDEIDEIIRLSHYITFNSFSQYIKYKDKIKNRVSLGIRVNPESSFSSADIYDPCAVYSRLGVTIAEFRPELLDGIQGLHFHALCEQNADALEVVLKKFEDNFGEFIPKMKWVNFGGGHHITREDYDVNKLITIIKDFKKRYDNIDVYMEPAEAIGWQSGVLVTSVVDKIYNGMEIAILDISAEAHMPDTIIMPYRAKVRNAGRKGEKKYTIRLGGNSCLSGDIMGDYSFDESLKVNDKIIFEDQMHYTIVKNTTFNGVRLPSFGILRKNGKFEIIKKFNYSDYKRRN